MLAKLLNRLGYNGIDDAVEFLVCGVATLPPLLMLGGFMLEGATTLFVLLMLVVGVGAYAPPPAPPVDDKLGKSNKKPPG